MRGWKKLGSQLLKLKFDFNSKGQTKSIENELTQSQNENCNKKTHTISIYSPSPVNGVEVV